MKKTLLALLLLFSCTHLPQNQSPTILVTVPPYVYFVEKIAGNAVNIEVLVPPGANPHVYEPTPSQTQKILQTQIWFCLNEPAERKILQVLQEQNPSVESVDLTQGIDLLSSNEHVCGTSHGEHHHLEESKDRHIWMSPKLAQIQAKTICNALIKAFPQHEIAFQKGLDSLLEELVQLDRKITLELAPFEGDSILSSHPAFGYFCKDYHLKQLSIECEGKDPLPQDVRRVISEAENSRVRSVFTEVQYNNRGALLIAKKLHLPVYEVDPYASDYIKNLSHIAGLIAQDH